MTRRRARLAVALAAATVLLGGTVPGSAATVPSDTHREWNELLRRHVHGGLVDYEGFRRDRAVLERYLESLAPPRAGPARSEELALWINAYNAATIDLVVRERAARGGRLGSIRDIPAAWSGPRWKLAGRQVTLDEIEHEILRKRFHEPRIHFALVCASRSCPTLRPAAYEGAFLDAQLDSAAREFVLDPTRNRFRSEKERIRISRIFDWYAKDFVGFARDSTLERLYGPERGAVLASVARYLSAQDVAGLRASRATIEFLPYDWSLNSSGNAR